MLRTANVGKIQIPTDNEVLSFYSAVTGFDRRYPTTDQGANEQNVIEYLMRVGWLGHKLTAAAPLDPAQLNQIKWSVNLFGSSRLGVNLPDSAMNQFQGGQGWDYVAGARLAGGHDVPVVKYDADGTIWIVTWGKAWPVTPAFMAGQYEDGTPYIEEAHCELDKSWISALGVSPSGFSMTDLLEELNSVV